METFTITKTSGATGNITTENSLIEGLAVFVITTNVIVSNIVNIVVWSRIGGIAPVTKFILLNLSASDLLVGIVACVPSIYAAFAGKWPFGDVWCQISGVVHGVSVTMSIWCISVIGVDRYIAVNRPFNYKQLMSLRNARIIMTTLWVCATVTYMAPIPTKGNFVYYKYSTELKMCGLYWEYPMYCVITTLYIPVASSVVVVFTAFRINRALNISHVSRSNANRKALHKLVASAVVFFICWTPYVTVVFISSFDQSFRPASSMKFWTQWLANCNSFMDVFVYSLTHKSFRQTVVGLFKCGAPTVTPEEQSPSNLAATVSRPTA